MAESKLRVFNNETIDMFWWNRQCGDGYTGYRRTKDSKGNPSFGAYELNKAHTLTSFMQLCIDYNEEQYEGFKKFVSSVSDDLLNNPKLETLWVSYCDRDIDEFGELQDTYAFNTYYIPAKKVAVNAGVPVDNYSPLLKGSLWSFAIRSGASKGAKKIINAYKNGAKEELALLKAAYSGYGNNDANRWSTSSTVSQYADAVKIYKSTYMKVEEKVETIGNSIKADIKKEEAVKVKVAEKEEVVTPVQEEVIEPKEEVVVEPEVIEEPEKVEEPVIEPCEYCSEDEIVEYFSVGTEWRKGQCINKKYMSTNYEDAKEQCILVSNKMNKPYYVFNQKGVKLFISNPKVNRKTIRGYDGSMDGYIIATDFVNGRHINMHGKAASYETAVRIADTASKRDNKRYKVYLNGDLLYTASRV